jgi:hypothetical protein
MSGCRARQGGLLEGNVYYVRKLRDAERCQASGVNCWVMCVVSLLWKLR